jgi:hypothetical protein
MIDSRETAPSQHQNWQQLQWHFCRVTGPAVLLQRCSNSTKLCCQMSSAGLVLLYCWLMCICQGQCIILCCAAISWGAYLYLYEQIKAWHRDRQGIGSNTKGTSNGSTSSDRLGATWNLLSAAQAGAMVSHP